MLTVILVAIVFVAGACLGASLAVWRRCDRDPRANELRGWLLCARALSQEYDVDRRMLARVRTRVPPHLRLAHEQHVSGLPARNEMRT